MVNFLWRLVTKLLARPAIASWLIARENNIKFPGPP
jgi:hypothetical protein